jgi:hypothetical protein
MKALTFSLAWIAVLALAIAIMRWMTRWSVLEGIYSHNEDASHDETSDGSYRGVSASIGYTRLALAVEIYPSTLWLKPALPIGLGLRPVSIPWLDIVDARMQRRWLGNVTTLKLKNTDIALHIKGRAGKHILEVADAMKQC